MTTRKSLNQNQIKKSFDDLFNSFTKEELLEQDARLLSFHFLSVIEDAMAQQGMSKKRLAEKVGTSASYITQLFRGDRLPNFTILAKIQDALNIKFEIKLKDDRALAGKMDFEFPDLQDQHGFWLFKNLKPDYRKRSPAALKVEYNEAEAV